MEKANTPNPGKSLGYIKCYSSSSLRISKGSSHSIRYKGQLMEKICSKLRIPKTILEIRKKTIYKLFKELTYHKMKTNNAVVFSRTTFQNILKERGR